MLWTWHQTQDARWLTCDLLADVTHAFGARRLGRPQDPLRPPELAQHLHMPGSCHWLHQIHSNLWFWTDPDGTIAHAPERLQGDALLSRDPHAAVWVCTADCVPILLATSHLGETWVAAIHAGWRGTAAQIVPQVVQAWEAHGIPPHSIRAALGPAISGPAYQVGSDVAEQVLATLRDPQAPDLVLPDPAPGKVRLDVRQANAQQLQDLGIPSSSISICPSCTFGDPDAFFSYRRDHNRRKTDVQWSGISPRSAHNF